jgi:hypothetical protein
MTQKLRCLLLIYLDTGLETPAKLDAAVQLINAKAANSTYAAGTVLLVRGPTYASESREFSKNFKDTFGTFAKLKRYKEHDEFNDTKFFINDLSAASPSNQTGGNGGGGDAVGKNQHRASFVDSSTKLCAWRFEDPIYTPYKIDMFSAESLDASFPSKSAPPQKYSYIEPSKPVQEVLAVDRGINFAHFFDSQNALAEFKTKLFKVDYETLILGQSPRVLTIGMNKKTQEDGTWVVGALCFDSLDDAFNWLVSRSDVIPTLRKNVKPILKMIVI